jgi:hypothetical protein
MYFKRSLSPAMVLGSLEGRKEVLESQVFDTRDITEVISDWGSKVQICLVKLSFWMLIRSMNSQKLQNMLKLLSLSFNTTSLI